MNTTERYNRTDSRFKQLLGFGVVLVVGFMFVVLYYGVSIVASSQCLVPIKNFPLTEVATLTLGDEFYYIIPSKSLNSPVLFLSESGERYHVLSEEKLRLLGPKFLATLSEGTNE